MLMPPNGVSSASQIQQLQESVPDAIGPMVAFRLHTAALSHAELLMLSRSLSVNSRVICAIRASTSLSPDASLFTSIQQAECSDSAGRQLPSLNGLPGSQIF
jgi:hypothetical protein